MASILNVDKIRRQAGSTDALVIDSGDRVTTPTRPAFFVSYDASSTSGLTGIVNFNTVHTNIGSHFDISNDRFVAPIAGIYHFSFSGLGSNDSSGSVGSAGNGIRSEIQYSTDSGSNYTTFAHGYGNVTSSNFWPNVGCSGTVSLAAGAWVVVNMTAKFVYGDTSGKYDPRFSGFLVG